MKRVICSESPSDLYAIAAYDAQSNIIGYLFEVNIYHGPDQLLVRCCNDVHYANKYPSESKAQKIIDGLFPIDEIDLEERINGRRVCTAEYKKWVEGVDPSELDDEVCKHYSVRGCRLAAVPIN